RDAAAAAGAPHGQRDLPPRARDVARAGASARAPRPLHGERQEGRHSVVLGEGGRRHRRPGAQRAEPHHPARAGRGEGARRSRVAVVRRGHDERAHRLAPDARADQFAGTGATDRRAVQQVASFQLPVSSIQYWFWQTATGNWQLVTGNVPVPAATPDLRWEAGGQSRSGGRSISGGRTKKARALMLWKGFQRPKRLEFERETLTDRFGRFYAQPFERGFGTTVGTAMRRVLLSSIEGAAVTAVKIDGVLHEFSPIPGVVEDATDIILNLKQIPLKLHTDTTKTLYLRVDKAGEVR